MRKTYTDMLRALIVYHKEHQLPEVDAYYWMVHEPGKAELPAAEWGYLQRCISDATSLAAEFGQDRYMNALLVAAYTELGKAYDDAIQAAHSGRK